MKKRILSVLLCIVMCLSLMPMSAFAADIASGTGWKLSDDGVLYITGDIPESGFNLTDEQKGQVKSVVAESGASISSGEALFEGFENMTSADLRLLNTTGVRDMSSMFMSCNSLTSLDVSGFDTSSVTYMNYMFYGCSSLTSLNLSNFNTISVTTMAGMFSECSSLTSLDVSGFKTDRLMYAQEMFRRCSALTSLGIRPDILDENADCIIAIRSPWQKKGSTDTYSTADELKAVTDIVTLLAVYTVTFDAKGGSAIDDVTFTDATFGELPTPERDGYVFDGWYVQDYQEQKSEEFFYDGYYAGADILRLSNLPQAVSSTRGFDDGNIIDFDVVFAGTAPTRLDVNDYYGLENSYSIERNEICGSIVFDDMQNNSGLGGNWRTFIDIETNFTEEDLDPSVGYVVKYFRVFPSSNQKVTAETAVPAEKNITLYAGWSKNVTCGIEADADALTFGSVTAGYAPVAEKTVAVSNIGDLPTGAITIALSGANADAFDISKDSIDNIAVGENDTFTVAPKADLTKGSYTATLTICDSNGNGIELNVTFTVNARYSGADNSDPATYAITVAVPVSGGEHSVNVSASVSGSTATVKDIKDADLEKVSGGETVEIDLSGLNKTIDTAKIPTTTVEKIAEQGGMSVKLSTATVTFDSKATETISEQAKGNTIELVVDDIKTVSLNAVQKEAVQKLDAALIIDVYLVSNGTRLCSESKGGFGGGKATVALPYEIKDSAAKYSVYYVDDNGKLEKLNASYDAAKKAFVFDIEHFSNYVVAYNENVTQFADVPANAYYYDAVLWAEEMGITSGVDAVHFDPNGTCTRAQAVTFLWRAAGCPEVAVGDTFTDVVKGSYYEKAVAWALANGITTGTSATTFSPDADCTRAQIVTFLHRANKVDTLNIKNNPFTDIKDGAYYYNAVLWAAENDITDGTSATTFSPDANCTRAQIVTFLYRFMNK